MIHKNQILLIGLLCISLIGWMLINKKNQTTPDTLHATIIVGTNAEYPPFSFIKDKAIVGSEIDIINEVARRLDKKIIFQNMPFDALIPQVQLGSIQVIAAGMTPTAERAKQVFFTPPHIDNDILVMVSLKDKPVTNIKELQDKRVVVNEGYTADYYVSSLKISNVIRLTTFEEALLALKSNRADVFVSSKNALQTFFSLEESSAFTETVIPDTKEEYALVVSKKYPELFVDIKKVLEEMQKDGTIDKIKNKWHL